MKNRITIRDVARAADISVTTVSLILNGKGRRFSKETRDKVLSAQQMLGYIPNYYAQSLVGKPSTTIGVIVPDIGNPFFSTFVKGIEDITFQHDIVPLIFDVGEDNHRADYYLQMLTHRTADGVILASHSITQTIVDQILTKNGIPYVATDQTYLGNDSDEVLVDDEMGGHLAIDYLVRSGHRRIAMVLPSLMTKNLIKRFTGYRKGLADHGIAFDDQLVFRPEFSRHGGYIAAEQIVKSDATAIFSVNDDVAIGL
ncbi:LacI family transcriptional regulator [Sporolactobacillus sp. THM7-4]|nr:LacI family transcriptional regulator [Sporolactobacillus sp. THM7-4]